MGLEGEQAAFRAQSGLPFSFVIVLHESVTGGPPTGSEPSAYAQFAGATFPVTASMDQAIVGATPWDGQTLPGWCALSPTMDLLACTSGHGKVDQLFDAIRTHAGI